MQSMKTLDEYCKDGVFTKVLYLHPAALMVLCYTVTWCVDHGIEPVISDAVSTQKEDEDLRRVSSTHREGRAFDISTRNMGEIQKQALKQALEREFEGMGAISTKTGKENLAYFHDAGTGEHLHVQLARKYAMPVRKG